MICIYVIILTLSSSANIVSAIETYDMEHYCDDELSMIWKSVYHGKLTARKPMSRGECTATIETWFTQDKLMFYFENLDILCSDGYFELFDTDDSFMGKSTDDEIKGLGGRICGIMPTKVFTTEGRHLKVKYTQLTNSNNKSEAVSIIFTSYMEGSCKSYMFQCDNGRCIDDDIRCEGYNSCGDNSECRSEMGSGATAGIVVGCLAGVCFLVTVIVIVICCKRSTSRRNTGNPYAQPVTYNAVTPGQQSYAAYGTPNQPYVTVQQPKYPGNVPNQNYLAAPGPEYTVHPPVGFQSPQQTQNMQAFGDQVQYPTAPPTGSNVPPPSYEDATTS